MVGWVGFCCGFERGVGGGLVEGVGGEVEGR